MTISILKALAVIVILALMIIVLLSVNHFMRGSFDAGEQDLEKMRDELDKTENVITDRSVFKELVKVRGGRAKGRETME